jgi:adenylate cyclase
MNMNIKIRSVFQPKPLPIALLITAVMLGCSLFLGDKNEFLKFLELKTLDLRFYIRGVRPPADDIVIVAVDDASIKHYGVWPWPRSLHAKMVDFLNADGAKAIGFDFIFADVQQSTDQLMLRRLLQHYRSLSISEEPHEGVPFGKMISQVVQNSEHDRILAEALKKKQNVTLPIIFQDFESETDASSDMESSIKLDEEDKDDDMPPPEILEALLSSDKPDTGLLPPPSDVAASAFQHIIPSVTGAAFHAPVANKILAPLTEFCKNARNVGAANVFPDIDGYQRWADMVIAHQGKLYPPFALQLVKQFESLSEENVQLVHNMGIRVGDVLAPLDESGRLLINYYGPAYSFKYYSYAEVLEKRLPAGTFKNKLVIMGYAATGLFDIVTTPFSEAMPGVEKHATVISNILQNDFLRGNRSINWLNYLYIVMIGVSVGLIVQRFNSVQTTVLLSLVLVTVVISDYLLFKYFNLWVNCVYPVLTHFAVSGGMIVLKYFIEEKDKRFLKATFERYITPELIDEMYIQKTIPLLGGEMRRITAFFSDIRNFSSFSEKLTAQQLVELLNEYLSEMTDILNTNKGTLDKYEGDAIIAFFGAPLELDDHAMRACRVAVAMQKALRKLHVKWKLAQRMPDETDRNTFNLPVDEWAPGARWPQEVGRMKMRIGINTGDIVVGNMGSVKRMDYTMIGDAVNLASRLEQACKQYGIYTMASEYTLNSEFTDAYGARQKVVDWVEARFIDKIIVAGRQTPTRVYEIRSLKGELTSSEKTLFELFDKAMQYYRSMRWDKAIGLFSQSSQFEDPSEDGVTPSEVFIRRCKAFQKNPPAVSGEKWDGVFHLMKK